jgi:hypothetical protein
VSQGTEHASREERKLNAARGTRAVACKPTVIGRGLSDNECRLRELHFRAANMHDFLEETFLHHGLEESSVALNSGSQYRAAVRRADSRLAGPELLLGSISRKRVFLALFDVSSMADLCDGEKA